MTDQPLLEGPKFVKRHLGKGSDAALCSRIITSSISPLGDVFPRNARLLFHPETPGEEPEPSPRVPRGDAPADSGGVWVGLNTSAHERAFLTVSFS